MKLTTKWVILLSIFQQSSDKLSREDSFYEDSRRFYGQVFAPCARRRWSCFTHSGVRLLLATELGDTVLALARYSAFVHLSWLDFCRSGNRRSLDRPVRRVCRRHRRRDQLYHHLYRYRPLPVSFLPTKKRPLSAHLHCCLCCGGCNLCGHLPLVPSLWPA